MKQSNQNFWKPYIANLQIKLSYAAYTKVSNAWEESNTRPIFNKMYYIIEGEGFVTIQGKTYYPRPGEIYVLPADVTLSYGTISANTFGKYWCHFAAKIGESNLFQILDTPAFIKPDHPLKWKSRFEQLIEHSNSDSLTSGIHVNAILLEIIAAYIESCDKIKFNLNATPAFEKMNTVLQYIETHLKDSLTVEDLAQIAHFHPNYFIQLFKNFTGYSPIQYIIRARLEKAKQLLMMRELNVSAIADSVGLELSYFSRIFREHNGFSPTAYRDMVPNPDNQPSK
jgi:AraC family transcriptional regulator of arabinose operon